MTPGTFESIFTKDLLTLAQLDREEILMVFETTARLKCGYRPFCDAFTDKTMVMLFEKPSLRTRVSFEAGFARLGGTAVYLDHQASRIGQRESISDYGRNLERWADVLVARTFSHTTIAALAQATSIPVINALSDLYHPCQALADVFTLWERHPNLDSIKLAYVGDGGNVCHSLLIAAATLGLDFTVISPESHQPDAEVLQVAAALARDSHACLEITEDLDAVAGTDAVYTDTWVSMGQEDEAQQRQATLADYQVTSGLMARAGQDTLFMHCLPAHRGCEVTDEVIDSPRSIVFDQAENRMHVQNAVLLHTIGVGKARSQATRATTKIGPAWPWA